MSTTPLASDAATPVHVNNDKHTPISAPETAPARVVLLQVIVSAIGITAEPIKMPIAKYTNPKLKPMPSNIPARAPIPRPKITITVRLTLSSCLPVAFGFLYVLYTS